MVGRCVGRPLRVGRYRPVAVSVGRLLSCLIAWLLWVAAVSVGRLVGQSLWVGRCEPNAIAWSLYTRRMRLVYPAFYFVLVSPLGYVRVGRVEWIGRVERVALSILLLLHHNSSSAPVYLGHNNTGFLSSLVIGKESQNPINMT